MNVGQKIKEFKESREKETILEVLKKILPERERWILEAIKVIFESSVPITGYKVRQKMGASLGSVYDLFDRLVDLELCIYPYGEGGHKEIKATNKGKGFYDLLRVSLSSEKKDIE